MDQVTSRRHLARHLAPFCALVAQADVSLDGTGRDRALGLDNAVADEFVTRQLRHLLAANPSLARRACRLRLPVEPGDRSRELHDIEISLSRALRADPAAAEALWALLTPPQCSVDEASADTVSEGRDTLQWVFGRHAVVGMLLTGAIAAVVLVGVAAEGLHLGPLSPLELAVIWILSFLPGWLYIRFIGQRAGAIWDEFVLNLHRLRLDEPQHLPQPPVNSIFYRDWFDGGGATLSRHRNIYRQKFDAYYGRCVSAARTGARLKARTFFPVVIATVIFAIGWTAILWDGSFPNSAPDSAQDMLTFGFLGAYLFDIQMLMRRFFQNDLKPSAYASAALRVVIVLILVVAMHQLPFFADESGSGEALVAFVIGLFPLVGLQALNGFVSRALKWPVPSLKSRYPLSDLEGLNVWYEARLMEEGIEDMQNLVSANMVDVLLHTRVPVGRLVDWCDQAQLFVHLSPRPAADHQAVNHPRTALAAFGVRSATTFLKAFANGALDEQGETCDPLVRRALERLEVNAPELSPPAVMTIARVLDGSPALRPIQSWRELEAAAPTCVDRLAEAAASPKVVELDVESRRREEPVDDDVA
jgi:hypothetical protein